jgi:DNA-binding response OmpR family regulator
MTCNPNNYPEESIVTRTADQRGAVLIVDDDPTILTILYHYLSYAGFSVHTVQDGRRAINQAELVRPDVILLDVIMPGADGFSLAQQLRTCETTQTTPIIFMTGVVDIETRLQSLQLEQVDFMSKPVDLPDVLARVTKYMAGYQAPGQ